MSEDWQQIALDKHRALVMHVELTKELADQTAGLRMQRDNAVEALQRCRMRSLTKAVLVAWRAHCEKAQIFRHMCKLTLGNGRSTLHSAAVRACVEAAIRSVLLSIRCEAAAAVSSAPRTPEARVRDRTSAELTPAAGPLTPHSHADVASPATPQLSAARSAGTSTRRCSRAVTPHGQAPAGENSLIKKLQHLTLENAFLRARAEHLEETVQALIAEAVAILTECNRLSFESESVVV